MGFLKLSVLHCVLLIGLILSTTSLTPKTLPKKEALFVEAFTGYEYVGSVLGPVSSSSTEMTFAANSRTASGSILGTINYSTGAITASKLTTVASEVEIVYQRDQALAWFPALSQLSFYPGGAAVPSWSKTLGVAGKDFPMTSMAMYETVATLITKDNAVYTVDLTNGDITPGRAYFLQSPAEVYHNPFDPTAITVNPTAPPQTTLVIKSALTTSTGERLLVGQTHSQGQVSSTFFVIEPARTKATGPMENLTMYKVLPQWNTSDQIGSFDIHDAFYTNETYYLFGISNTTTTLGYSQGFLIVFTAKDLSGPGSKSLIAQTFDLGAEKHLAVTLTADMGEFVINTCDTIYTFSVSDGPLAAIKTVISAQGTIDMSLNQVGVAKDGNLVGSAIIKQGTSLMQFFKIGDPPATPLVKPTYPVTQTANSALLPLFHNVTLPIVTEDNALMREEISLLMVDGPALATDTLPLGQVTNLLEVPTVDHTVLSYKPANAAALSLTLPSTLINHPGMAITVSNGFTYDASTQLLKGSLSGATSPVTPLTFSMTLTNDVTTFKGTSTVVLQEESADPSYAVLVTSDGTYEINVSPQLNNGIGFSVFDGNFLSGGTVLANGSSYISLTTQALSTSAKVYAVPGYVDDVLIVLTNSAAWVKQNASSPEWHSEIDNFHLSLSGFYNSQAIFNDGLNFAVLPYTGLDAGTFTQYTTTISQGTTDASYLATSLNNADGSSIFVTNLGTKTALVVVDSFATKKWAVTLAQFASTPILPRVVTLASGKGYVVCGSNSNHQVVVIQVSATGTIVGSLDLTLPNTVTDNDFTLVASETDQYVALQYGTTATVIDVTKTPLTVAGSQTYALETPIDCTNGTGSISSLQSAAGFVIAINCVVNEVTSKVTEFITIKTDATINRTVTAGADYLVTSTPVTVTSATGTSTLSTADVTVASTSTKVPVTTALGLTSINTSTTLTNGNMAVATIPVSKNITLPEQHVNTLMIYTIPASDFGLAKGTKCDLKADPSTPLPPGITPSGLMLIGNPTKAGTYTFKLGGSCFSFYPVSSTFTVVVNPPATAEDL